MPTADVLAELSRRGLIAESTDREALGAHLAAGPVTFYCGFDPTAPSLHVGHLLQFMVLRALQRAGHQPIVLIGGATGLIGDPRPTAERVLTDKSTVAGWVDRIRARVAPFLDLPAAEHGLRAPVYANNLDWTGELSAIDFLRELGKHFRVNRMLVKDAVSARLNSEAGISYTEFSYQILQSNDFRELHRRYGCTMQTGGSDQWGNITAGIDLVRRTLGVSVHALGTPLIVGSDGQKIGKTEGARVWLDPAMTSPYAFFQFWLNTADADALAWLPLLSERPEDEVEALLVEGRERPASRAPQRALAADLTTLVHGAGEVARVEAASRALFGHGDLADLAGDTLAAALTEAGAVEVDDASTPVGTLLVKAGLASSLGDARRTADEGGVYINNARVTNVAVPPAATDWLAGGWLVLRKGRRTVAGVHLSR